MGLVSISTITCDSKGHSIYSLPPPPTSTSSTVRHRHQEEGGECEVHQQAGMQEQKSMLHDHDHDHDATQDQQVEARNILPSVSSASPPQMQQQGMETVHDHHQKGEQHMSNNTISNKKKRRTRYRYWTSLFRRTKNGDNNLDVTKQGAAVRSVPIPVAMAQRSKKINVYSCRHDDDDKTKPRRTNDVDFSPGGQDTDEELQVTEEGSKGMQHISRRAMKIHLSQSHRQQQKRQQQKLNAGRMARDMHLLSSFTALHRACFQGRSPRTIGRIITKHKWALSAPDSMGRLPLHVIVAHLCEGKGLLQLEEGFQIIDLLAAENLEAIHHRDTLYGDTPMDIVHDALLALFKKDMAVQWRCPTNTLKDDLALLLTHLRKLSIRAYLEQKHTWEKHRFATFGDTMGTDNTSCNSMSALASMGSLNSVGYTVCSSVSDNAFPPLL